MMPSLQVGRILHQTSPAAGKTGKLNLYVTSAVPYFFNMYSLPLHRGERPAATERGVNEPVPIADDGRNLYVGSFDDSMIYTYPLPISPKSKGAAQIAASAAGRFIPPFSGKRPSIHVPMLTPGEGVDAGVGDPSGLAVSGGYLYVSGSGEVSGSNEVVAYKLPLVSGESPSASITNFSLDFWSVAASGDTLYVASVTAGTVGAYHLPLTTNESPEYTIPTFPQDGDGAAGVAVDPSRRHLYVSLHDPGDVYQYRLPYRKGEAPTVVHVHSQTSGCPYGIAVGNDHLFMTTDKILAYQLPLTARSKPELTLEFNESDLPADLAVGE